MTALDEARSPDPDPDGESASESPTRIRYLVLAVGWSLALLIYVQRQGLIAATPKIQADLHFDTVQASFLFAAFLIPYGIFQVPCGLLGERFGARTLLTILVLGWSVLTVMTAFLGTTQFGTLGQFYCLLALRIAFGAFQAGGFPVWARVITDWMPMSERGMAQGSVWMSSRIGGAIGPILFVALYKRTGTWTTPLVIIGGLGFVWCVIFWWWFRNSPDEVPQVNAAERRRIAAGRTETKGVATSISWKTLFTSRNVWALSLMYGSVGFAGNFVTSFLPTYLSEYRHASDEMMGWMSSLPLAFGVVSCVSGGFLSDWIIRKWGSRKWGRRIVPMVGLAIAGLTLLMVPRVESLLVVALLFSVSFFCNDLMIGPAWAACVDVGEKSAGSVSGTMNMLGQFSGAAGMLFAGWMLQYGRQEMLFSIFGCCYAVACLCWLGVDVTTPLHAPLPDDPQTARFHE